MRSVFATAAVILATGCPGGNDATNPTILWLAPDNSEVIVKLSAVEPPPW
ncbi:MAG: hypothetical protein ABI867_31055 [Kofleriaceae bacterium]